LLEYRACAVMFFVNVFALSYFQGGKLNQVVCFFTKGISEREW